MTGPSAPSAPSARRLRSRAWLLTCLAVCLMAGVTAGCSGMPTTGPIVETRADPEVDPARPMGIDPDPPVPGASRAEIANGFLNAMRAWPQSFDVARDYLAREDQGTWNPDLATVTYADRGPVLVGSDGTVGLRLLDASRLDGKGAWRGQIPASAATVRLSFVREDGEYRIVDPPDQHLVPTDWFAERFRQANLYFFDPTSSTLVPEPVFVPVGEQLASTLVQRLLAGPPSSGISTTAFPAGLTIELSVPVSDDGLADIRLEGAPPPRSQDVIDRMLAQLAWTLGQEGISSLRLTISGEEMRASGSPVEADGEFDVDSAPQYDPAGYDVSSALFGLVDGRLVTDSGQALLPVDGVWGQRRTGLRSVAVDPTGETAAGVSRSGTRLVLAPVQQDVGGQTDGRIVRVVDDATDLLRPSWDFDGRVWLVDRTDAGARVSYVRQGRQRVVDVPGVSGRRVAAFLVSRDGTRFVAVVRQPAGDQVRVGRVVLRDDRAVARVLPAQPIEVGSGQQPRRLLDLAWTSTTTLAALSPVVAGERYEVRTVSVDGSPTQSDTTSVNGPVVGLVGTPVPDNPAYAATPTSLFDLSSLTSRGFAEPVTAFGYTG